MQPDENEIDNLVLQMQNNINDIWRPEFADKTYILRWLKARDYDVKKSEVMLRNHIVWRINENVDTILEQYQLPEVYEKYGVGGFCGHDKEGRPVWFEPLGLLDPHGFLKSLPVRDIHRVRVHAVESMYKNILPQRSKEEGKPITQSTTILDLEHFGLKHLWKPAMECTVEATKLMEANYPESMVKLIIIKAPPIFKIAYNIAKPFLQPGTQKKLSFFGSNYKEELLNLIDADQLPAIYGGNMYGPDSDPYCRHLIRWGGQIPLSFYLNKHVKEIQASTVKAKSKLKLSYLVSKPESILHYEFSTKEHDINFGIYYIGTTLETDIQNLKSSKLNEIIKLDKVRSNLTIEMGDISITKSGYYMVEFDNSYSWTTSKYIHYRIEILDIIENENNTV